MTYARFTSNLIILSALFLGGCNSSGQEGIPVHSVFLSTRPVKVQQDNALYAQPVACVTILPTTASPDIEEAVARHLSSRIDRVIGPIERAYLVRRLALDLTHSADQRVFALEAACNYTIEANPYGEGSLYAVFWTRQVVGVHLMLRRAGSDQILWQARYQAARSDGGLPLSPFSAIWNAAEAGAMASDYDVQRSLLDETLRHITDTLPDFRTHGRAGASTSAIAKRYGLN